jgi:hypothetical protein
VLPSIAWSRSILENLFQLSRFRLGVRSPRRRSELWPKTSTSASPKWASFAIYLWGELCKTGSLLAHQTRIFTPGRITTGPEVIAARATSARSNAASGPNTSATQAPPSSTRVSARQPITNLCGRISAGNSEVCPELTRILQNGNNVLRRKRCGRRRGPRCDKGNPAARRVRKATDLQEVAGLPNRGRTCAATPGFWQPPRLHC